MKKKPENPSFHMPMEDLLVLAPEKIAYTRRPDDATALAGRGWSAERITALETSFHDIGKLPTDSELEQEVRGMEQKKNDQRKTTTTLIQTAMGKVNQVHHDESPEYRAFGVRKLYDAGDPAFALLCEQISRVGQRMLVDGDDAEQAAYTAAGLTPAEFIAIGAEGDEFRRLIVDVRTAQARRDIGTQQRLRMANPAYRDLAALCETGKAVFISNDEARYNDYVIYDPAPEAEAAKPSMGAAGAMSGTTGSSGLSGMTDNTGGLSGRTSHMTDGTSTDTGERAGGMASRGSGGDNPYTGAPAGM